MNGSPVRLSLSCERGITGQRVPRFPWEIHLDVPLPASPAATLDPVSTRKSRGSKKQSAGRRRNYGPTPDQIGIRKYLPNYWANWLGFALFGFVGLSMFGWGIYYVIDATYADAVVAIGLAGALGYMVFLFGSTRLRD